MIDELVHTHTVAGGRPHAIIRALGTHPRQPYRQYTPVVFGGVQHALAPPTVTSSSHIWFIWFQPICPIMPMGTIMGMPPMAMDIMPGMAMPMGSMASAMGSMAGQNIVINVNRGDEIVVYAYTGTWLADFPMNHYTHWVGLLLKPNQEEVNLMRKQAEEGLDSVEAPMANGH